MDYQQRISAKANINTALKAVGLPTEMDENFRNTPARWLKYIESFTQAYNPDHDLGVTFPVSRPSKGIYDRAMVIQTCIPYHAVCAHHLLPVLGEAHVGYIPKDRVVGLSKLSRLVEGITHALPSLQEDVCDKITEALMHHLDAHGAMCVITAEHGCMSARGVQHPSGQVDTVTSSIKGAFQEDANARAEFYNLVNIGS